MSETLKGSPDGRTVTLGAAGTATEFIFEPGVDYASFYADGGEIKLAYTVANGDGGAMAAAEVFAKVPDTKEREQRLGPKNRAKNFSVFVASTAGATEVTVSTEQRVE